MMTISRANSIHFVKIDGLLPNVENTLSFDEKYAGFGIRSYCQKWDDAAVVKVQVVSDSAIAFTAPTALTAGTPTTGGLCTPGTHSYKVTFTSVGGGETTAGTVSNVITCVLTTGQTVPLSAIPTGPAGTTGRKLYRTVAGNLGSYLLLTTITNNTTTIFSDTVADGSLGAAAPASNTTVTVPTVNVNPLSGAALADITAVLITSYPATSILAARYYFEFDVSFSSYANRIIQIKVTQGTDVWTSEYQQSLDLSGDMADGDMVLIQYTNKDAISVLPNTQIDYTTGIEFSLYVEAVLKDISYQIEDKMFTNIGEKVLIESQTFKARKLATMPIPEFLTDKIAIAGKCFTFLVNDIQYTTDGVPEVASPASNLRQLVWTLVHTDILGFTSDDKSINLPTMDGIIVRYNNAISSTWTFVAPAGYLFHTIVAGHGIGSAGDYDLDVGYTLHGVDVVDTMTIPLSGSNIGIPIHLEPVFEADTTVYVEISGAGAIAKIYVQLLKNTP